MLTIRYEKEMKKQVKLMAKQGRDMDKLTAVLSILAHEQPLPQIYKDRKPKGKFKHYRECHIEPDWLLIYKIDNAELILTAVATGTHADLFDK